MARRSGSRLGRQQLPRPLIQFLDEGYLLSFFRTTGIFHILQKFAHGHAQNPRYQSLMRLCERSLRGGIAVDACQPPMHISAVGLAQASHVAELAKDSCHRSQRPVLKIFRD